MNHRRYIKRRFKTFTNSGRPGIDNFNLNAALDKLTSTATNVSNTVQQNLSAINQIKTSVGAGISGIKNQVKSVFNGSPLPATPTNSPQMTYNSNAMNNLFPMLGGGSNNTLLIVGVLVVALGLFLWLKK